MAYFDNDFYSHQKGYVIPQDPAMFEALQSIDRKTMRECNQMYGLGGNRDWMMNTIANVTFEAILEDMAVKFRTGKVRKECKFNFYNLFGIIASNRELVNGDKDGNLNVAFTPGSRAIELISLTERPEIPVGLNPLEEFAIVDNSGVIMEALTEDYLRIDRFARFSISKKHSIMLTDDMKFAAFAVLDRFIMNLFEYMLFQLGGNEELKQFSVNFNDNCEFHARRKKEGIIFSMRPGMNAKLIIKCDDATEEQDEDDEDDY